MLKLFKILFILIIFTPVQANAELYSTPPKIDDHYQMPDHMAEAKILLQRFKLLEQRSRKLAKGEKITGDVDDLLRNLFLPKNAQQFRRNFAREINVIHQPNKSNLWLKLAQYYTNRGNHKDAATTAFMAYATTKVAREKASALVVMGEVYVELGQIADGLNIINRSLVFHKNDDTIRRFNVIKERFFLTIRDISVNVEQASPNACIVFSKMLKKGQHAEDYVTVTGLSDIDINAKGNQICLNGLEYGKSYEVTIKKGLKGDKHTILDHTSTRKFTVHDRSSRASFENGSYVVSRTNDNMVPLTTVNISHINLTLYHINDRNLIHENDYSLFEDINSYKGDSIKNELGSLIWQGEMNIEGDRNTEVRTLIPLKDMITKKESGIYILVAREPEKEGESNWRYRSKSNATQWLLVSDMGLTTVRGKDGLHVFVRSLKSAHPLKKISVNLIAHNNKILGTVKTDKNGIAHFPEGLTRGKGGDAPIMVTAEDKAQDYNFLKLQKNYLDLSERGVSGRVAPDKQDAFLYTDRGVYRPGETVKLSALLRDPESHAIGKLPITFYVTKPDGSTLMEKNITGDDLGGYGFDIPISPSAIPGSYTVISTLTKSSQLGQVSFQVEDFVPQRIRARLKTDEKWLEANKKAEFILKANFLYGPPATDLKSETRISLQRNYRIYADYTDFHFGLVEDTFYSKSLSPIHVRTDKSGQAIIAVNLKNIPDTSQPLLAYLQTNVFDVGGRPVNAKIALPIRLRDVEVGLKKSFNGSLSEGDDAIFEIIALNKEGKPVKDRVIAYELVKEEYYYSWYRSGRLWNNRRNLTDSMVETGEITTDENGLAKIKHVAKDGRYRLNILDEKGSSAASTRYYVGWWSAGSLPNVPDELEMSLKETAANDGDILTAFVKAPFAGKARIMVMNDHLRLTRNISLPKEGREISIKVDKDWGTGAYLMVTAFRPEAAKPSKLPVRATNLKWFSINKGRRSTKVSIETPDTVLPRQTITLPVSLSGGDIAGKKMRLTIAAVDEGILGLTDFSSPNPLHHFLSKRRLGMTLADLYGRLIKPVDGVRGQLRTGGDRAMSGLMEKSTMALDMPAKKKESDENATGVQTKTVKTVALYERDVEFDKDGMGVITLDLPDFNGRLRLMVVAYGADVVGQGSSELIVRDPVVADLLLPRFLSPGDRAQTTLSIHNLSGEERSFTITLNEETGLQLSSDKSFSITLEDGKRFEKIIPLKADKIGDSKVSLMVQSDGLPDIKRHWDIAVRPAQSYVSHRQVSFLASGEHEVISTEDINGFLPGTISTSLTLTDKPDFDVPNLLDSLYLYPYACGEQTTSRALPLLYYGDVANAWNKNYDPLKMRRIIDKAILHLLDLQKHNGSFALWRSTGSTHPWLTAYIFEFLSRAKEQNIDVPTAAYDHTRNWLKNFVNNRRNSDPHVTAYAYYVLARIGDISPSAVRYFADNQGDKIQTRIGLGHLAAALNLIGEKALSDRYFEKAIKKTRPSGKEWHWYRDFGSDLRDGAALAALISEASSGEKRQLRIAEALDREFDRRKYFSTQEQAWLLLATHSMSLNSGEGFQVSLNQNTLPVSKKALRYSLNLKDILKGFDVENIGTPPIRVIQSIRAVPATSQEPVSNGFEITRKFLTLKGKEADLKTIKQNDMLVVVIQGWSKNKIDHEALIVDLLPSGFEIENAAIGGYNAQDEMKFLPRKSNFLYEAARDDRYVAAMNLGTYSRKFATSYIVRAVTPGTYMLPAVFVEDMYKPQYHARGAVGTVTIIK